MNPPGPAGICPLVPARALLLQEGEPSSPQNYSHRPHQDCSARYSHLSQYASHALDVTVCSSDHEDRTGPFLFI
jgi:hypothetical protein